jgi:hypothetical protein
MSWSWPARLPVPLLDAVVEGAWPAVWYAGIEIALGRGQGHLPWPIFMVAAGAGVLIGRMHFRSPAPLVIAALLAGGAGWLAAPEARDALASGGPGAGVPIHAAGWILGLALARGARHDDPAQDDLAVSALLRGGMALLVVPWLAASAAGSASRTTFVDQALPPSLLFICGGLLAVGISRLQALGRESGWDWRQNRAWWALLGIVVLVFAMLALFAGLVLGRPVDSILSAVLQPVVVAGSYVVLGVIVVLSGIVAIPLSALGNLLHGSQPLLPPTPPPSALPGSPGPAVGPEVGGILVLVIVLLFVAAGVALALFQRASWRPPDLEKPQEREHRSFVLPRLSVPLPRPHLRWPARVRPPTSASAAYAAALSELERMPSLARDPGESPAAHSRRLQTDGVTLLALWRLAADYQLERFAGLRLAAAETRRALRRWARVRAWARSGGAGSAGRRP